jgi:hypothetical protein
MSQAIFKVIFCMGRRRPARSDENREDASHRTSFIRRWAESWSEGLPVPPFQPPNGQLPNNALVRRKADGYTIRSGVITIQNGLDGRAAFRIGVVEHLAQRLILDEVYVWH